MRDGASGAFLAVVADPDPSLLWAAAFVVALAWFTRAARRLDLDPRAAYWTGMCALLGGLWGGHLLGLYVHGSDGAPLPWLRIWAGGKSYYGGLVGGALAGMAFLRLRRLSVLSYADAIVPAVSLGYAIGRVGCFLNGDDYGAVSHLPWSVVYPPGTEAFAAHVSLGWIAPDVSWSLPVHPAQLYASLVGLGMFVLLANWRPEQAGSRFCLFMCLYGLARFFLEYLRGDFRAVLGPLSLPQLFSALFLCVGLGIWLGMHRGAAAPIWQESALPGPAPL